MLHLIQKSPFQSQCLNECLKVASDSDSFLLMLDGTYALQSSNFLNHEKITNNKNIFVLEDDLLARGLSIPVNQGKNITTINYQNFVDLTLNNSKTISWY
jgi:tRNA 2-thiouridine synthesizing protein B